MLSPEEAYQKLIKLGDDWADKKAAAELLVETRRPVRAQLAMAFLVEAKSMAKAEIMAEASGEYDAHVRAMVEAVKEENKAMVRYKAIQAVLEMERTQEATRRAEMKNLGGLT